MILTIKQGASQKRIKLILDSLANKLQPRGVDVYKYVGKISLKKDALDIQKELRDEWK